MPHRAAGKRIALVDTSFHFALTDPRDQCHQAAAHLFTQLSDERWLLVMTNYVFAETHALLVNRAGHDFATEFVRAIDRGDSLWLVHAEMEDERQAKQILFTYRDKRFSFTDTVSFAMIKRLNIPWAVSFDDDFRQYGIPTLPER